MIVHSLSFTLTFNPSFGSGTVGANVTGSMSFTQVEVIVETDEFGNDFIATYVSNGTLSFSGSYSNGIFNLDANGGADDGCRFSGTATVQR